jgi:hypothetical protein
MTQHTSRLCKGCLTKKASDGVLHQTTWPPQWPDLKPIEMVWDELDRRVRESSQQVLSNTFLVTTWFHKSSLLFYNVESSKNKEKPLSRCVQTFDWHCIYLEGVLALRCSISNFLPVFIWVWKTSWEAVPCLRTCSGTLPTMCWMCQCVVQTCIIYEQNYCLTWICYEIPDCFSGSCAVPFFLHFLPHGPAPSN